MLTSAENTWSWHEVKLSNVLLSINQINCSYIWLMGLERGHNVGDINLVWKSAIGLVLAYLTGSPWPAGRGCWSTTIYGNVSQFCCNSDFTNCTTYAVWSTALKSFLRGFWELLFIVTGICFLSRGFGEKLSNGFKDAVTDLVDVALKVAGVRRVCYLWTDVVYPAFNLRMCSASVLESLFHNKNSIVQYRITLCTECN